MIRISYTFMHMLYNICRRVLDACFPFIPGSDAGSGGLCIMQKESLNVLNKDESIFLLYFS